MEIKSTPLTDSHIKLGAYMQPFAGFNMPIYYTKVIDEHLWTRNEVSIFDTSHMGVIEVDDPTLSIDHAVTQNLNTLKTGKCRYGFLLNSDGGIIDDIIIYRFSDNKFMLVVNASTVEKDLAHIRKFVSADAKVEYCSKLRKIDVQGPKAREVLRPIVGEVVDELRYFNFGYFEFFGLQCVISRTGYTGELGFELYIEEEDVISLWSTLLDNPLLKPAGLGARDSLRLEMCYPLYGVDLNESITPLEAGLENFIDFSKQFSGKDALVVQSQNLKQKLIFFMCEGKRIARHGYDVYCDNNKIGFVTGGTFSPTLNCPIGAAYIDIEHVVLHNDIVLRNERGVELAAQIVEKPFYKKSSLLT